MGVEQQIRETLSNKSLAGDRSGARALQALATGVPSVTFSQIVTHRDNDGAVVRYDVTYFDEIHDPSRRSLSVDVGG